MATPVRVCSSASATAFGAARALPIPVDHSVACACSRSQFWGSSTELTTSSSAWPASVSTGRSERRPGSARAEGFDLLQVLGGRGLQGGEQGLKEDKTQQVFKDAAAAVKAGKRKTKGGAAGSSKSSGEEEEQDSFGKELAGLTGGFPGGEKGLKQFVVKNPPPPKGSKGDTQLELQEKLAQKQTLLPPLLLPGMTVRVIEPKNPYHLFTGIVQRVTDGKAGVIFEGGNWDKLVSFKITDLERTAKGPPMSNPKSAILELEDSKP